MLKNSQIQHTPDVFLALLQCGLICIVEMDHRGGDDPIIAVAFKQKGLRLRSLVKFCLKFVCKKRLHFLGQDHSP